MLGQFPCTILYLSLVEPTASLTTQHIIVVVQFTHQTIMSTSLEPTTLSTTQHTGGKGGAIYTLDSTFSFHRIDNFISSSARDYSGAIFTHNTVLNFSGINHFF